MARDPIIEVEHISKTFTSTRALVDVGLKVYPGEIRGLIGENGSGKSTLSSIISGNLKPDEGRMFLYGQPYAPADSFEASEKGISMIVQEQGTIETVSVAANIFAGREKQFCHMGFLNSRKLTSEAQALLNKVGLGNIRADRLVSTLSFEDRKLVEIARAFYRMPELFIVDETTTALPQKGRNILYGLIRQLKEAGKAVLFISHDIEELTEHCDSVTILRDGKLITTLTEDEMDPHRMKTLMVGREVMDHYYRNKADHQPKSQRTVLKIESISKGILKDVSFELKEGEIIGFAGLSDCGMHDLGKILFGLSRADHGEVFLEDGTRVTDAKQAIAHHVGFMSKDRDKESMLITLSVRENVILPSLPRLGKAGFFITPESEKKLARKYCDQLSVKCRNIEQPCSELSGGNKQKVVLAKWLACESEIFILDCPTRGIDIGVKEAIYKIMEALREEGRSIIMISEELPEVLGMSDRVFVMKDGRITKEFYMDEAVTENDVIQYMI